MKDQEKERNRKFLRHMVRLVRKTLSIKAKQKGQTSDDKKLNAREILNKRRVEQTVDDLLPA